LNTRNLDEVIASSRYHKKLYLGANETTNTDQIIKNLRALGYIRVKQKETNQNEVLDEYVFEPSDLALVQTSCSPQFYARTYFLSGLRSFEFVEGLCQLLEHMIKNENVRIGLKSSDSALSKILPPEIYLSFKNRNNLEEFLSSKINIYGSDYSLSKMIKVIPYNSNALDDLKKTWMNKLNNACVFISASNKENIEEFKKIVYDKVKELHIKRYPYNNFLY
jgi:hypothetical protein